MAELRALERLAKEPSGDKRRELMSRLTDFLTLEVDAYPEEITASLGETLVILLDQVDETGRAELSNRVAANQATPRGLARKLAQDASVPVAEPVLTHSPVLTDDDLVEVAANHSQGHLLAMSRRSQLSAQVTDAIIDHGTRPVFQAVASNHEAVISENGFRCLSEHVPADDGLAEALSQRTDIPEAVVEQVITSLPPQYGGRLEALWASDKTGSQTLLERAARRVSEARLSRRLGLIEAKAAARQITNGARTLDSVMVKFAGSNRLSETVYVLSAKANLPEKYVRAALLRADSTVIAVICRSIDLTDKAFEEVTRMRGTQLGLPASDGHRLMQAFRSLDIETAKRTLRFAAARTAAQNA